MKKNLWEQPTIFHSLNSEFLRLQYFFGYKWILKNWNFINFLYLKWLMLEIWLLYQQAQQQIFRPSGDFKFFFCFNLIYLIFALLLHYPNFTTFQQWTWASWGVVDIRQTSWSYSTHHPWAIFFIWDHSYITSAKGWVQKISVFADIQYTDRNFVVEFDTWAK